MGSKQHIFWFSFCYSPINVNNSWQTPELWIFAPPSELPCDSWTCAFFARLVSLSGGHVLIVRPFFFHFWIVAWTVLCEMFTAWKILHYPELSLNYLTYSGLVWCIPWTLWCCLIPYSEENMYFEHPATL